MCIYINIDQYALPFAFIFISAIQDNIVLYEGRICISAQRIAIIICNDLAQSRWPVRFTNIDTQA